MTLSGAGFFSPMHDIRAIRDDPAAYDRAWAMKGFAPQTPAILAPDETLQTAQARRPN